MLCKCLLATAPSARTITRSCGRSHPAPLRRLPGLRQPEMVRWCPQLFKRWAGQVGQALRHSIAAQSRPCCDRCQNCRCKMVYCTHNGCVHIDPTPPTEIRTTYIRTAKPYHGRNGVTDPANLVPLLLLRPATASTWSRWALARPWRGASAGSAASEFAAPHVGCRAPLCVLPCSRGRGSIRSYNCAMGGRGGGGGCCCSGGGGNRIAQDVSWPARLPRRGAAAALAAAWRGGKTWTPAAAGQGVYGRLVYRRQTAHLDGLGVPYTIDSQLRLVDRGRRVAFVADGASWVRSIGLGAAEILRRGPQRAGLSLPHESAGTLSPFPISGTNQSRAAVE